MNETSNQEDDLWTLAGRISTAAETDDFFARLLREKKNYAEPGVKSIVNVAIATLIENSKTDVERARRIIEKHILPVCLQEEFIWPPELLTERAAREVLSHWIEQYPDEGRIPLRGILMERVMQAVKKSPSVASVSTLATFGVRSRLVESSLLRLIGRKGPLGDAAINAMCSLSPAGAVRARLIRAVIERESADGPSNLHYAIQALASPKFIPMLRKRLLRKDPDLWIVPFLLGRISDRSPGDRRLQSRVWRVFEEFLQKNPESANSVVAIGNTLAVCNSPDIVQYVLANIAKDSGINPYSAFNLLKSCYRPEQLTGWITNQTDLKARLAEFAALPGSQTRSMTLQDVLREAAWETAFCAGIVDVSDWLSFADLHSPMAVAATLTYASFSPSSGWPAFVTQLVTEKVDVATGSDRWYLARIAAVRMLSATETMGALDLLLDCGLTGNGAPLYATTTPAADLVERCSLWSGDGLLEHLIQVCQDRTRGSARISAIFGLQRLATLNRISPSYLDRILSLSTDDSLPDYALAALIWIIGSFEGVQVGDAIGPHLAKHLEVPDASEAVAFQSVQAMIHLGIWPDYGQILTRVLELVEKGLLIDPSRVKEYRGWQAYALGLLVARAPDQYEWAAKQVLENGPGEVVHLLLQALDRSPELAKDVADHLGLAATERSVRVLGRSFGETENFEIIGRLAPKAFVATPWEHVWGDWMPQVRCALADSLRTIADIEGTDKDRIFTLLKGLLADSAYIVRRSASRTYARMDPGKLEEVCQSWMRSGQTELRTRSAESAQWLPVDNNKTIDNAVIRRLLEDPEPSVRKAAQRSTLDLRAREWSDSALAQIRSRNLTNPNMMTTLYRYGRVLASLGDDETITLLEKMQSERNLPVAVKNWLAKLAEDTEKHWKEVIQKWPDALPAWSGQIEELEAAFEVDDQRFTTSISLWRRLQENPSDLISWGGGFLNPSLSERMRMVLDPKPEPLRLRIEGRNSARIWCNGVTSEGQVSFVGTGPYPYAVEQ